MNMLQWYADWQNGEHAKVFDFRAALDNSNLIRNYDSFNDVRLLDERVDQNRNLTLLEVGCATGEFFRYLQIKYPRVNYYGIDISQPAIARAKEKYPEAKLFVNNPDNKVSDELNDFCHTESPEIVYTKDVVHHQTRPFDFLSDLLKIPSETLIIRCRTRDVGQTEMDPERSCQYYGGWVPFIVMNVDDLVAHIKTNAPQCEIVMYRNHMVLGGQLGRYLPKDCYLKETGTAETAIGVFKNTSHPGKVHIENRNDMNPHYTLGFVIKHGI